MIPDSAARDKALPDRELGQDKLLLLDHFRSYYAQQIGQTPFELDSDALQYWERYSFPGNTRELRNIVIRLITKYPGKTVDAMQLRDEFDPLETAAAGGQKTENRGQMLDAIKAGNFNLDQYLHEQEYCYITAALELASGNISEAARLLGINRTTLHSRLDAHEKLSQ